MRILLDYRPALRDRTGVGEYVHELARALLATAVPDEDLHLFTSSWKDRPSPDLARELPGVRVVDRRIPVRLLNAAWHRLRWPPVEHLGVPPLDVAQSLHPLLIPSRAPVRAVTVHDLDFLRHPERVRAEIRRDYPALARRDARAATLVVAASETTARDVEAELDVPAANIVVCRPGLPAWVGRPAPRTQPDGGYVLFFGTLEPRKNVGTLLDAWSRLAGQSGPLPRLRLAGAAGAGAGAWLDRIARPPLAGRVEHVGYVRAADRRELYAGARALVLPSLYEGFGMPALEAMALGVPVVASNRGALPEVVGDAGLLVDPEDADALAEAIRRILDDRALADACAARGLARAAQFDWTSSARALRDAWRAARSRA